MDDNNNFNYNGGFGSAPYGSGRLQPEMTLKNWIVVVLLSSIPCVNIIMLLIWAFSAENQTRSNYAKATLIVTVAFMVISVALSFIVAPILLSSLQGFY